MKIYAYVALAVVLIAGAKWGHSAIFNAGWNAAIVEQEQAIATAKDEAVAKARQQWENMTDLTEKEIVVEEKIVEVIRIVEKEIPKIVERIVTVTPECADLGADFARLLNRQVNSGADRSSGGTETVAEPDS